MYSENRSSRPRTALRVFCLAGVLLLAVSLAAPLLAGAALPKAVFINDDHRTEPIFNYFKRVDGDLYVTVNCFDELDGFNYTYDQRRYQLYVRNSVAGTSLTFDMNSGQAMTADHRFFDATAAMINHVLYVPAYFMANWLNYGYYELGPYVFLFDDRITKSFSQLIAEYEDSLRPAPTPTRPPEPTLPPVPTPTPGPTSGPGPTPTAPPVPVKDAALFFKGLGSGTGPILDLLEEKGVRAVFFVSSTDILSDPAAVRRITAGGHRLGVYADVPDEAGDAEKLASLKKANDSLEKLLKLRVRFCLWDGILPPGNGYIRCSGLTDLSGVRADYLVRGFLNTVRAGTPSFLLFGTDGGVRQMLPDIFKRAEKERVSFFLYSEIQSKNFQ